MSRSYSSGGRDFEVRRVPVFRHFLHVLGIVQNAPFCHLFAPFWPLFYAKFYASLRFNPIVNPIESPMPMTTENKGRVQAAFVFARSTFQATYLE